MKETTHEGSEKSNKTKDNAKATKKKSKKSNEDAASSKKVAKAEEIPKAQEGSNKEEELRAKAANSSATLPKPEVNTQMKRSSSKKAKEPSEKSKS